jgi:hypothetical protein
MVPIAKFENLVLWLRVANYLGLKKKGTTMHGNIVANQQQQQPTYLPKVLFIRCWSGGRNCMFLSRALLQYSSVVNRNFIYFIIIILFQILFNSHMVDYPQ